MRITDKMIFEQARSDVTKARDRATEASLQVSSGVRVSHPGDDPAAAGLLVTTTSLMNRFDAIQNTAKAASDELNTADSALSVVSNALTRAKELAVQLATSTNANGRPVGAEQIGSIIQEIVAALNTKVADRYIFGGNIDDTPPFDDVGNYYGDDGVRAVEIAPNVTHAASIRADVAMKGASGGVDIFAILTDLVTALSSDDTAAIQAAIDPLATSISQVADARGSAGNAVNAFDTAVSVSQLAYNEAKKRGSDLGDADIIEASTELTAAQQALQASLAVTAKGFQFTLLDYLK